MKLFSCGACGQVVPFEDVVCDRCNHALGFDPQSLDMLALTPVGDAWQAAGTHGTAWKYCGNAVHGVCNWLIPAADAAAYCMACRHNLVIPDLGQADNIGLWKKMEQAKRRLFYTLLRLKLPLATRADHAEGLGFEFLTAEAGEQIMTGHEDGRITIALIEADDSEREKRRHAMGEPYRTLLGHFRHEVGHWYWDRLVRDGGALDRCREVFGNDSDDYGAALKRHYAGGPRLNWQDAYVSSYAGAHAWEDFAETFAHYLHILDTLETGGDWRIALRPHADTSGRLSSSLDQSWFADDMPLASITAAWLPLTLMLNAFNRSLGHRDLYAHALSDTVVTKLGFIHDLVHGRIGRAGQQGRSQAA